MFQVLYYYSSLTSGLGDTGGQDDEAYLPAVAYRDTGRLAIAGDTSGSAGPLLG